MSKTNHHSPLAVAYAQALLDLATERQQAEAIGAEFNELRRVIDADPMFHAFLSDPAVRQAERTRVLDSALAGQLSPLLANFLLAVNGRGHLGALPEMAAAYTDLLDRQLGKVDVDVTTAKALDAQELEGVRQRVSDALKKQANVRQKVDESIIGGLVLQVEDRIIDASVRSQLQAMRQQMIAGR